MIKYIFNSKYQFLFCYFLFIKLYIFFNIILIEFKCNYFNTLRKIKILFKKLYFFLMNSFQIFVHHNIDQKE